MAAVDYIALVVGFLTLGLFTYRILCFLWILLRCYVLTSFGFVKNLNTYGEWAVITGASDGIGKEYALQLASRGLNIVLISRTKAKLERVENEIKEQYNVLTKIICFDFSKTDGYDCWVLQAPKTRGDTRYGCNRQDKELI